MKAFVIYAGDSPSDCMTEALVCSRECAEEWLDHHAPFHGGYDIADTDGPILCDECMELTGA
jgi:hypothetical protein